MSRILVIDDDSGHRLVLKSRLADAGHDVLAVDSGARGLTEARSAPFDVFLVHARLASGVDGFEVCRRLRGIPERSLVPIVLFEEHLAAPEEIARGYEAGCDAFVTKSELPALEHVLRVFQRHKSKVDEILGQNTALREHVRRQNEERARTHDASHAPAHHANHDVHDASSAVRELASSKPDGVAIVDAEGTVRYADRGASELLGSRIEGAHLGDLAPASGLEAFVRDARIEGREGHRFEVQGRKNRSPRSLAAAVVPLLSRPNDPHDASLRVLLLNDGQKRRVAAEYLRIQEPGVPRAELGALLEAAREVFRPEAILGVSGAIATLRAQVAAAAGSETAVLLRGEPGSGRERVAKVLHFTGSSTGPFLHARCAGPADEVAGELFGCAKNGSAAGTERPGLAHLAIDGTLYLEEISELAPELQEKLAKFLATGMLARRGGSKSERVSLRLVASTSADLEQLTAAGKFDRGLYEALAEHQISIPPLASRREDVPVLARHFAERFGARRGVKGIDDDALAALVRHEWTGGVAELEDAIEQACARAKDGLVTFESLPRALRDRVKDYIPRSKPPQRSVEGTHSVGGIPNVEITPQLRGPTIYRDARPWDITDDEPVSLDLYEKKALLRALHETDGDRLKAAKLLKVGKSTLYRKLKRYEIT